jgi:hypothetical protein
MSLAEVLPQFLSLSRIDKLRLIQLLAEDLQQGEQGRRELGRTYPVRSPGPAFAAAAALLRALEEAPQEASFGASAKGGK